MWEFLIALNLLTSSCYALFLRASAAGPVDKWALVALLQTATTAPLLIKAAFAPPALPAYSLLDAAGIAAAAGLIILAQFLQIKSLQHLEASVASVVFTSRIFFATLFGALLLSEQILPLQLLGGALIFIAVCVVRQKQSAGIAKLGVMYGLSFAAVLCALNVLEKMLIAHLGYEQYALPGFALASLLLWVIVLVRRAHLPRSFLLRGSTWLMMASRAAAGISFSAALAFGPMALTTYLGSLSVITVLIFGALFLGERDYLPRKIVAALLATAGAGLVIFM